MHDNPKEVDYFGRNKHNLNFQECLIEFLIPEKIPDDWWGCRDLEVTLVHELLHTRLMYFSAESKRSNNWHLELAIETIAKALVAARRGIDLEDLK